jgi:hypothetical protein
MTEKTHCIQFPVIVKGARLMAIVEEKTTSPGYFARIRFSDGFIDQFTITPNGRVKGTKLRAKPYAQSIRFDISHIFKIVPGKFFHVFQHSIRGNYINVWILERETAPGQISYAVFYRQFYRFELVRFDNKWVPYTKSNLFPEVDQELITKIQGILVKV